MNSTQLFLHFFLCFKPQQLLNTYKSKKHTHTLLLYNKNTIHTVLIKSHKINIKFNMLHTESKINLSTFDINIKFRENLVHLIIKTIKGNLFLLPVYSRFCCDKYIFYKIINFPSST